MSSTNKYAFDCGAGTRTSETINATIKAFSLFMIKAVLDDFDRLSRDEQER